MQIHTTATAPFTAAAAAAGAATARGGRAAAARRGAGVAPTRSEEKYTHK